MLGLKSRTDPAWVDVALSDELSLMRDHAHLERKAAGHVITLMGQVPHAADRLLEVVKEELEHYEQWPRDEVKARWDKLATAKAEIVADIEWGPRIH